ncbi:hypothetical protein [Blautia marasmi]|uniref:hypothetical protein n=1 Tax=Blautia marasmi TaxID=1917868 RepID=UPI00266C6538|nr:hypothetical protein [Blautia marasmi]
MSLGKKQENFKEYCKTVQVSPDYNTDVTVSPLLFGNNLEHTRSCIHNGISAQMLKNRKFAGKPECYHGCPAGWYRIGEKTNIIFNEKEDVSVLQASESYTRHADDYHMKRRHECNAVTIVNHYGKEESGIGQSGISVQKDCNYECRLAVKVWQPTVIRIALTDRDGNIYIQEKMEYDRADFEVKSVLLHASKLDENADLTISFDGCGTISIGAVSLLPEKNFHGMRPDVVELLREIGVKLLRWPGGNFAGEYNWKDGLLPVDMRAPFESYMGLETQPHSMGYDFNEINTDDFIALCREIGAEPFITINPTWNTPEECAQWVEYCNGDGDTEYGRLRIERGYKEPYNVRFWSLGNEFGYGHMEGDNTPIGYGKKGIEIGKKMLEVSPGLTLCSSGPYPNKDWVEHAARPLGQIAPLVSLHSYVAQPLFAEPDKYAEEYYECISKVDTQCRKLVHKMRSELNDDTLRISFDEWNVWYGWYRPKSVNDGIFTAAMLHMLMEEANPSGIYMACHFEAVNEGAIRVEWDKSFLTPSGQMFSVMKNHIGGKLCFAVRDAVATEKNNVLTITLINRSYDGTKKFKIPKYGETMVSSLYSSENVLPYSDFAVKNVELQLMGDSYEVLLPRHSVMLIQMKNSLGN